MTSDNKFLNTMQSVGKSIIENFKTKWIGCFISVVAWVVSIISLFAFSAISEELFNGTVFGIIFCGIILYTILSVFSQTSSLAPIALMVCSYIGLLLMVGSGDMIDYISTQFFGGVSLAKIFSLPFSVWFSIFGLLFSFIVSSVAMYFPQNRKSKLENTSKQDKKLINIEIEA